MNKICFSLIPFCLFLFNCTSVNTVRVNGDIKPGSNFVTTGSIKKPYKSMGLIQVMKRGSYFTGYIPIVEADLQTGFKEVLEPAIKQAGADGVINVQFTEIQYNGFQRVFFTILFFVPWPRGVLISGELVKLQPQNSPAAVRTP